MRPLYNKQDPVLANWLLLMCASVAVMVFIGGYTRLTGSGLSMTNWQPITGFLPPASADAWQSEFAAYKASPEYKKINYGMNLEEFKSIFWVEFIHRVAGRAVGLLYALPLLFFIARGRIQGMDILRYIGIGLLIGGQGVMGWYMVKSGLIDNPHVSHFRLAAHLMLAVLLFSALFWQYMKHAFDMLLVPEGKDINSGRYFFFVALILVYIQIFLGGLVAGLGAGHLYNLPAEFPFMGQGFAPDEFTALDYGLAMLSDPASVQYLHRFVALLLFVYVGWLTIACYRMSIPKLMKLEMSLNFALVLQISLGIITLLTDVNIFFALAHQLFALVLLSSVLWGIFLFRHSS